MALTKVTGQVVNTSTDLTVGVLTATTASFTGNVSVGGTLTYEDVTNVDSVGLITARNGIEVTDKGVQVGTGATVDSAADNVLTFLTNGNERIRVTSDGKVGINTDMGGAPASLYPFSVYRSTGTGYVYTETAQSGASAGLRAKAGTSDFTIFTTQGTGQLAVYDNTNTAERLRIDSSGRLLLGTTTEGAANADNLTIADSGHAGITIRSGTSSKGAVFFSDATSGSGEYEGVIEYQHSNNDMLFFASGSEWMRIESSGNIGIKNTVAATIDAVNSAGTLVVGDGSSAEGITIYTSDSTSGELAFADGTSGSATQRGRIIYAHGDNSMRISTNGGEALRIDTNSTILHGTTSAANLNNAGGGSARQAKSYIFNNPGTTTERYSFALIGGANSTSGPSLFLNKTRSTSVAHTVVQDGDELGQIRFQGSDGTYYVQGARIEAAVDGTPGSQDMPGRLIFSTTADGSSSPTERLRIASDGQATFDKGSPGSSNQVIARFQAESSRRLDIVWHDSGSLLGFDLPGSHSYIFKCAGSERLRITSSGDIGIGNDASFPIYTDSTDRSLIIGTGSNDSAIQIHSGTTKYGGVYFGDATSGAARYRGYVEYKHDDDFLRFATAGSERLRITSAGFIGVNDSTPGRAIDVLYDDATTYSETAMAPSLGAIRVFNNSTTTNATAGEIVFGSGDSGTAYATISAIRVGSQETELAFRTSDSATLNEAIRINKSGQVQIGLTGFNSASASLSTLTGGNSSSYAYMFIAGGSISNYKMLKAGGKFLTRGTAERNIDLVQAVQCVGNMNILITVKFKLNSAVNANSGEILCQADMHATSSGNWSYGTKTPQLTNHFSSGYGTGSLAWVGGGTNTKILRYTTDSNINYTNYMIEEIVITGYDNANTTLL